MKKKTLITVIIIGGISCVTLWASPQVSNLLQLLKTFTQVMKLVEDAYVQEVDPKEMVKNAMDGMLSKLDPHSNYLEPKIYRELQIRSKGRYEGLGFQVSSLKGYPTIIAPFEGTPAYKAGLQSGDVITKIDGSSTKNMNLDVAVDKMRGTPGTKVTLSIAREGNTSPFDLTLTREVIELKNVPYYGMIGDDIGYIRLAGFSENAGNDVSRAIDSLILKGSKKFILDLRSNPGGLLEEAVRVSEDFLPRGKLIVSTRGRDIRINRDFYSTKVPKITGEPLVVLVNRGSASASEIVAGAIQDWDAGLICGDTTFGKGSVQTVRELAEGAVKLTTARYYTPSGKCIDKADTTEFMIRNPTLGKHFTTLGPLERELISTGSIIPDIKLSSVSTLSSLVVKVVREGPVMEQFSIKYVKANPKISKDFEVTDRILEEFKDYISNRKIEFTDEEFNTAKSDFQKLLRERIAGEKWGETGRYSIILKQDPWVTSVCELMNKSNSQSELFKAGGVK